MTLRLPKRKEATPETKSDLPSYARAVLNREWLFLNSHARSFALMALMISKRHSATQMLHTRTSKPCRPRSTLKPALSKDRQKIRVHSPIFWKSIMNTEETHSAIIFHPKKFRCNLETWWYGTSYAISSLHLEPKLPLQATWRYCYCEQDSHTSNSKPVACLICKMSSWKHNVENSTTWSTRKLAVSTQSAFTLPVMISRFLEKLIIHVYAKGWIPGVWHCLAERFSHVDGWVTTNSESGLDQQLNQNFDFDFDWAVG